MCAPLRTHCLRSAPLSADVPSSALPSSSLPGTRVIQNDHSTDIGARLNFRVNDQRAGGGVEIQ